ncbi:hypothetical protein [Streptomyces sp. 3N207]|uniref:hypothetical protein n=1 Tax=Streptomyces sp. 3N207 TaxID=3457417 RepID=UPI003FD3BCF2
MKPTVSPTVLTNAFYAFYDLHRPIYHAYASSRLMPEEAQVAVAHLFDLVASNWSDIVKKPRPAAWAWQRHTHAVAQRTGRALTAADDAVLLHEQLRLSIDQIATVTGTEPATVTALLAAARRGQRKQSDSPGGWHAQHRCAGRCRHMRAVSSSPAGAV